MSISNRPRCLVWTGPRESDIQDCEEGLFAGSITLYGTYVGDGAPAETFDGKNPRFIGDAAAEVFEKVAEYEEGRADTALLARGKGAVAETLSRYDPFNASFCESRFFYGRMRINHNEEDAFSDLFILMEQVKLIAAELTPASGQANGGTHGCRVLFMGYNPNFSVTRTNKGSVEALDDLLSKSDLTDFDLRTWAEDYTDGDGDRPFAHHAECLSWYGDDEKEEVLRLRREELARLRAAYEKAGGDVDAVVDRIVERTVCINTGDLAGLMRDLDDKAKFREMCRMVGVPTTESITVVGTTEEASIASLRKRLTGDKFIVQRKNSSGGFGTFLFEDPYADSGLSEKKKSDKLKDVNKRIEEAMRPGASGRPGSFVLSRYRDPNIPVNVHVIIGEHEILKSPYSVQIITKIDNKLIYSGADFIAFRNYARDNPAVVKKLDTYVDWFSKYLQGRQYRGVIGFDIIISDRTVEFVEANNRFQASTVLLNRALRETKYLKDGADRVRLRIDSDPVTREVKERYGAGFSEVRPEDSPYRMIVLQDRKPSVQMLNLFAFPAEGGGKPLADEIYQRCYPNWKWRNVTNSRDSGAQRFPMTNPDFSTLPIPFSCYMYYNGSSDCGDGGIHADHALNMVNIILEERRKDLARTSAEFAYARLKICREAEKVLGAGGWFHDPKVRGNGKF